jgi:hypothetical protein
LNHIQDISLPPLSHKVVRLRPLFFDKLTANLFTLMLTANAVTSERTDVDYLFHKNSIKSRSQLIANLRQSAFFWTGFSEEDVLASVKSSTGYLAKEHTKCSDADRGLLKDALHVTETILASDAWKALSRSHELGVYVKHWPVESAEHWSFDAQSSHLLTGLSQLLEAQRHVNQQISSDDPGDGLSGLGVRAVAPARYHVVKKEPGEDDTLEKPVLMKAGIPTSSLEGEPALRRRNSTSAKGARTSPTRLKKQFKVVKKPMSKRKAQTKSQSGPSAYDKNDGDEDMAKTPQETIEDEVMLAPHSPFAKTSIVGTTSSKLSYLISQVLLHYRQEKILIFYDGENAAFYIAEMLELLHIKHEIYAKSLAAWLKAEYVVRFDQEEEYRVLLMDVRNAAYGLNLPSASRIYFVNPTCRPNVEAQAIKRAHRIGQTRPVYVETLVLEGTIEEKMLERSKRMTRSEHREAGHLEDDTGIREIIQSARPIPISDNELLDHMAPIETPQQLWGREGYTRFMGNWTSTQARSKKRKSEHLTPGIDDDTSMEPSAATQEPVFRRTLAFVDCRNDTAVDPQERNPSGPSYQVDDIRPSKIPKIIGDDRRSMLRSISPITPVLRAVDQGSSSSGTQANDTRQTSHLQTSTLPPTKDDSHPQPGLHSNGNGNGRNQLLQNILGWL